jgi:hypothetical protein
MRLIWNTRVATRVTVIAVAFLAIVIGAAFAAEHGIVREPSLQSEQVNHGIDRAKKGDRLDPVPSHDAVQNSKSKRIEPRIQVTKLAVIGTTSRYPTGMNTICLIQTRLVRT